MKQYHIVAIILFFFNSCSEEKVKPIELPISSLNSEAISFFNQARIHEQKYELIKAREDYQSAIKLDPNFILAHINLFRENTVTTSWIDLSNKNIEFLDLQYNDTSIEKERFYSDNSIRINEVKTIDNFNDLNGIASLIEICDFVITVSNTNAHISGALGKKTFLLLPKGKGRLWYWTSKGNKSLWYPSIEVVEQNVAGSWNSAINKLSKLVKENVIG